MTVETVHIIGNMNYSWYEYQYCNGILMTNTYKQVPYQHMQTSLIQVESHCKYNDMQRITYTITGMLVCEHINYNK